MHKIHLLIFDLFRIYMSMSVFMRQPSHCRFIVVYAAAAAVQISMQNRTILFYFFYNFDKTTQNLG